MGKGRRPNPTALKVLTGNPGHRPLNDAEPQPAKGIPERPKGMWRAARREWDRIVPVLAELGVLTVVDGKALAAYCDAYALWEKARQEIDKHGLLVEDTHQDKQGNLHTTIKQNPAITIYQNAAKSMKSFLIEFGLTPASRAKLKIEKKPDADPMEDYMKGRNGAKQERSLEDEAAEVPDKFLQ